jgi:cellulose synthase (UDP-forming)
MLSGEMLFVNLLLLAGLLLYVREAPPTNPWARLAAVLFLDAATAAYAAWRWENTLPELEWSFASLWPWCFFAAEMFVTAYETWALFVLVRLTDHSKQADAYEAALRRGGPLPTVDVFIPTYNESREVLEATLAGARALDYPPERVRVWVLDDGRRPWLRELCAAGSVGYFARPSNEHGKAGNLNFALPRTAGELVLVIDADFVLEPQFLYRTAGFLVYQERVALVQTPQHFRNPDPVQHNLLGTGAWTEEQHFFMNVVQSGRDAYENAFCVGSGWLVKRACLEDMGGFPQGSICEDLEISYVLRGRGLRTLFLNEPLAVGLAPESLPEYVKQRVRWCTGTLQHLFLPTGPLRGAGLSLLDRVFYLEPVVCWLTYPFILMLLAAPILYWFTGVTALDAPGEGAALVLLPRFLAGYVLWHWLSRGKVMPPVAMLHRTLPAFHLTAAIAKTLLSPFGAPFQVTAKGEARDRVVVRWSFLWLFLAPAVALLAGMAMNLTGYCEVVAVNEYTPLDVLWGAYTVVLLLLCALVCVELPKRGDATAGEAQRACPWASLGAVGRRLFG